MVRQIMRIADRYFNAEEAGRARVWPFTPPPNPLPPDGGGITSPPDLNNPTPNPLPQEGGGIGVFCIMSSKETWFLFPFVEIQ